MVFIILSVYLTGSCSLSHHELFRCCMDFRVLKENAPVYITVQEYGYRSGVLGISFKGS